MEITNSIVVALSVGFFAGIIVIRILNKNKSVGLLNEAKKEAEKIIELANEKGEHIKKNKIIQAKEKFLELKSEHEKIIFSREDKIKALEHEVSSKENLVESTLKKQESLNLDLDKKLEEVENKISLLDKKKVETEKVRKEQIKQLEAISGLSETEAKESLLESLKKDAENDALIYAKEKIR